MSKILLHFKLKQLRALSAVLFSHIYGKNLNFFFIQILIGYLEIQFERRLYTSISLSIEYIHGDHKITVVLI